MVETTVPADRLAYLMVEAHARGLVYWLEQITGKRNLDQEVGSGWYNARACNDDAIGGVTSLSDARAMIARLSDILQSASTF